MTTWEGLAHGFGVALQPGVLVYCLLGVTLGTFIGVLPGIGAMAAISLLLPITFYISPEAALVMLAGVYYGRNMAARWRRSCCACRARRNRR